MKTASIRELRHDLNRVLAFCFKAGRTVTDWIFDPPGLAMAARRRFGNGRPFRAR